MTCMTALNLALYSLNMQNCLSAFLLCGVRCSACLGLDHPCALIAETIALS